jgi:exodeoxyribonuclease VII large subunit
MNEKVPNEENPDEAGRGNMPVWTVSELSQALKRTVESAFPLVRVRAEVSGFIKAGSGHLYMTLKDDQAVIDGVCWRGTAQRLGLALEAGMEVIATGRLSTYPGRSKYQIIIDAIELAGEGALLKLLEDRRKRLAAEGLFDAERKRPLPFLPEVIGVVTSPTGAVIRDILHRLADRFPRHVLLWPVLVQGEAAAGQIAAAIDGFNAIAAGGPRSRQAVPRPDLLIVARGGGSLEDLWAFNEEIVVRAAAASDIPLISAVGHETDNTLIDFAADQRAPTPSAAAEMAVPVRSELLAQVLDDGARLVGAWGRLLVERKNRLDGLARGLPEPGRLLDDATQRLDDWAERLRYALRVGLDERAARTAAAAARIPHPGQVIRHEASRLENEARGLQRAMKAYQRDRATALKHAGSFLESLSYTKVIGRGYAVVRDGAGKPLVAAAAVKPGMDLAIEMRGGQVAARAVGGPVAPAAQPKSDSKAKQPAKSPGNSRQGKLL